VNGKKAFGDVDVMQLWCSSLELNFICCRLYLCFNIHERVHCENYLD